MKHSHKQISSVIGILSVWGMLIYGINQTSSVAKREERIILERAIKRAAVQCYAIEGIYPPNLEYIKEHYGIVIDCRDYNIYYEVFADNIMPEIQVLERR